MHRFPAGFIAIGRDGRPTSAATLQFPLPGGGRRCYKPLTRPPLGGTAAPTGVTMTSSQSTPAAACRTLGVEEEFQIVDPDSRGLAQQAERLLDDLPADPDADGPGDATRELHRSQIETATGVCESLAEVREQVTRLRRRLVRTAAQDGVALASAAMHPFSDWHGQGYSPHPEHRYEDIAADFAQLADETILYGLHVHVGIPDQEAGLEILNRVRSRLAPMLALSASSPFWLGDDTGYASYRSSNWLRWPTAGQPDAFADLDEYRGLLRDLTRAGVVPDTSYLYWDLRLSENLPTIEYRVCDACTTIDETVLMAGLFAALTQTCHHEALAGTPPPRVRPELVKGAHWRAARHGMAGVLADVHAVEAVPAATLVDRTLSYLRPALEDTGDWDEVRELATALVRRGNSAQRQRAVFRETGELAAVVDHLIAETAPP